MMRTILSVGWLNLRRDYVALGLTFLLPIVFFSIFAVIFGGMGEAMASGATVNATVSSAGITDESDIVWAPEDENVPMPGGLEDLWKAPENKSWQTSYTEATRQSKQSGKPLLIWFTDTAHSPLCRRLSDDLFSNSGFDGWASKRLVRLRVDSTISSKEKREEIGAKKMRRESTLPWWTQSSVARK